MKKTLTLICASLLAAAAVAQESPQLIRVFEAQVQPNSQRAYEALLAKFAAAHRQLDTQRYYFVSSHEVGSPTTYAFAAVFDTWAAMDREPSNVMFEAYGEEEAMEMLATIDGRVTSQRSMVLLRRLDLSPAGAGEQSNPALVNWLTVKIKPYGNATYEAYLRKVAEATEKVASQFPFITYAPGPGADNTYGFANPIASWAAMDEGPGMTVPERLEAAFGAREAQRLLEQRASVVDSQMSVLVRPRPDLSYQPEN